MAENVLAKLTIALGANTAEYKNSINEAARVTQTSMQKAGGSLTEYKQKAQQELGQIGRYIELQNKLWDTQETQLRNTAQRNVGSIQSMKAELRLMDLQAERSARAMKDSFDQSAAAAKAADEKMEKAFKGIETATKSASNSIKGLLTGALALAGVNSIRGTLELASQYNVLSQRIKMATKDTNDYKTVSEQLYAISKKNGSSLEDTVGLFQKMSNSAKDLGANNKDILKFINTLQEIGTVGGASAQYMSMAMTQLSQALALGVVHAQDFKAIIEDVPQIGHEIAAGMGITMNQLREKMMAGKLTSEEVFRAILKRSEEVDKQFAEMPKSMDRAYESLKISAGKAASDIDKITNATVTAVYWIDQLAKGFDQLGSSATNIKGAIDSGMASPVKFGQQETTVGNIANAAWRTGWRAPGVWAKNIGDAFDPSLTDKQRQERMNARNSGLLAGFQNQINVDHTPIPKKKEDQLNTEPTVDKKWQDKHKADVQRADDLLASMRAQNAELEAKLNKDDQAVTKEKALLALSKDRTLTDKERNVYASEINKLAAQHAALVKQEAISKEQEKLAQILAGHKEKIQLLKNELSGQTEENSLLQAQKQIQDAVKVGKKETAAAQKEILAAAKEEAVLKDAVKLKSIEDSLRHQLEDQRAQNSHAKELIPILNAEKAIRDAITAGMDQNVAQQQRIRDLAKQQSDEVLAKQFEEERKKLDSIGASLDDENEKLKLKLAGQENLGKYLDTERDIRKQIAEYAKEEADAVDEINKAEGLTDDQKQSRIDKTKKGYDDLRKAADDKIAKVKQDAQENTRLNQALTDQDRILENIKNGTDKYKDKLAELDRQYLAGNITQKQWQKTADELWKAQAKNNTTLGDGIKQIGQSFSNAIANGQKLGDVVKSLGKQLAVLAAQKLLFEPIANWIDNTSNRLMGRGQYAPQPTLPSTSGGSSLAGAGSNIGSLLGNSSLGSAGSSAGGLLGDIASALGIPKFASGGYSQGGMALVGEQGPEFVNLPAGAQIFSNQQSQSMGGLGSAGAAQVDMTDPSQYNFRLNPGFYQDPYYDGFQQELADMDTRYQQERARKWVREHPGVDTIGSAKMNEIANNQWGILGSPSDIVRAGGRTGWGAGNQHVALMQMYQKAGISVSPRMMAAARLEDDNWNSSDFHIMSLPTGGGVTSFGAGDGGAQGSSVAGYGVNEGFDYTQRGKQVGSNYIGASQEYLNNLQTWKTPSGVGPGADSQITGDSFTGGAPMSGFGGRSSEYQINPDGSTSPIDRGAGSYKFNGSGFDFVPSFDPTVDSSQYQHQDGTYKGLQADWNKNARNVGSFGELAAMLGEALGAPGTLSTSNTGNDIFGYTNDLTMAAQRKYITSAKFYKPQTDGFTAGQIAGQLGLRGFANGGSITGGELALVGEQGPELFMSRGGGKIMTADQTKAMLNKPPVINVINQTSTAVDATYQSQPDGSIAVVLRAAQAQARTNMRTMRG